MQMQQKKKGKSKYKTYVFSLVFYVHNFRPLSRKDSAKWVLSRVLNSKVCHEYSRI